MSFVASISTPTLHGVYAIERTPPAVIRALGTGAVWLVGQFPWGPDGQIFHPADPADRALTLAPPGMDRTGSAYLSTIQKAWVDLRPIRVVGNTAARAAVNLVDSPTTIGVATGKYKGAAGNSIQVFVQAASDGDPTHFDLRVVISGLSGSTEEIHRNFNFTGANAVVPSSVAQSYLLASVAKSNAGRPDDGGPFTLTGGSDGTVTAGDYTGVAGTGDEGIALAESDKDLGVILADDPGNSMRAAVNSALQLHAQAMGNRVAVISGNSGLSLSAVQTDAALYRSTRVVYVDNWVRQFDDVDGTLRLLPPTSFMASVMSQVSPSTSPAWKAPEVIEMLSGIREVETARGLGSGSNTQKGICTIVPESDGGFTFESGVVTIAPNDESRKRITRTRMGDYIVQSFKTSVRRYVDGPNVPLNQDSIMKALSRFMNGLKQAQNTDPDHTPHVLDWAFGDLKAFNPQAQLDNGYFVIPLQVKTSAGMEFIFLSIQFGENVVISATAA